MAATTVSARELPLTETIVGRSKLTGGTVSVALKGITENSLVYVSGNTSTATGAYTVVITAGTGFSITSSVGGDAGYVAWMVVINHTV
jgi:hypothetical protein